METCEAPWSLLFGFGVEHVQPLDHRERAPRVSAPQPYAHLRRAATSGSAENGRVLDGQLGVAADDSALVGPFPDVFDLDLWLGELTSVRYQPPLVRH